MLKRVVPITPLRRVTDEPKFPVRQVPPLEWINGKFRPNNMLPNPRNINKMDEHEFERLKESIRRFNYAAPILLNVDNMIAGGFHRQKALIELGRGAEFVDVRYPSRPLTDAELQEYAIRDNQTGRMDKDLLLRNFDKRELLGMGFDPAKDFGMRESKFAFRPGESNPKLASGEQQGFDAFLSPFRIIIDEQGVARQVDIRLMLNWVRNVVLDFSGGKDSALVAYWFRRVMPNVKVYGGYCDIGVEIPSIGPHVIDLAEWLGIELAILKSDTGWWEFMKKQGWPSMIFRQCQTVMLHKPLHAFKHKFSPKDTIVSDGGRKAQGVRGSKKTQFSEQGSTPGYQCFRPAFFLEEGNEIEMMTATGMPVWEGYKLGFKRTACWLCPGMNHIQAQCLNKEYPGLCNEIRKLERRYGKIRPMNDKSFDDILYGKGKDNRGYIDGDYESNPVETTSTVEDDELPF